MTRMQNGFQALYPKKPESPNQSQYRGVNSNSTGGRRGAAEEWASGSRPSSPGMLGQLQSLSQTPRQNPGFNMSGPQQAPVSAPVRRSDVPAWSLNGGISPQTQQAGQAFNQVPQPPAPVNTGKIISDRITENMNNASIQGRQDANDIVDRNLNARMGFYSTPQARRSGFFQRGMGPMAGDAAIMQRQSQPLGDGGPAAYAARSDQENRRRSAEQAMGGASPDGLTRYTPNRDVLAFANQDRAREDQRISGIVGGGTQMRPAMEAMTPSEIQFYRHKMNMLTNPAYAERVNTERADRREMLDNRRNMVRARREGALEAAGASQQLRNLMAGRGAVGPGADGMAALTSLTARSNPALALNHNNQMAMMDRRAQLERDMMDRATKMAIYSSGMSGPEMDLALQRFEAANSGTPITSPLHTVGGFVADPNATPRDRYLAIQKYFSDAEKSGSPFTDEQKRQIMVSQGVNPSEADIMGWRQDAAGVFDSPDYMGGVSGMIPGGPVVNRYVFKPLLDMLGLAPDDMMRNQRMRQALK